MNLWLIVGFPLWIGIGYTIFYTFLHFAGGKETIAKFGHRGFFLYPIFVFALLITIILNTPLPDGYWFQINNSTEIDIVIISIVTGIVTGILLYNLEFLFNRVSNNSGQGILLPAPLVFLLPITLVVVISEEIIWRGYLIGLISDRFGYTIIVSGLLSAIIFGAHHYFFGWRAFLSKTLSAMVWMALVYQFHSLIPALFAHFTADSILWYKSSVDKRKSEVNKV